MTRRNHFSGSMEKQSDEWLQMCISNPEKFEPSALQAAEWEIARRREKRVPVAAEIWAASYGFKTSDVIQINRNLKKSGHERGISFLNFFSAVRFSGLGTNGKVWHF